MAKRDQREHHSWDRDNYRIPTCRKCGLRRVLRFQDSTIFIDKDGNRVPRPAGRVPPCSGKVHTLHKSMDFFLWAQTATIGKQIEEGRASYVHRDGRRGLLLEELGDMCGLQSGYLSKIERSRVMPNGNTLIRIAKALGVPLVFSPDLEAVAMKANERTTRRSSSKRRRNLINRQRDPTPPDASGRWINTRQICNMWEHHPTTVRNKMREHKVPFRETSKREPRWYLYEDVVKAIGEPR